MNSCMLDVIKASTKICLILYGICSFSMEVLYSSLPLAIILISTLSFVVYFFHIPRPSRQKVEAVIGKDPSKDNVENGSYVMRVVGHRGACLDAPENSLAAFKLCADKGCDAVEFDVSLTEDNIPVIFHDTSLERLTESSHNITDLKWDELKKLDISVKHPLKDKYAGTRIATLDETIEQCLRSNQRMFIDIKNFDRKVVDAILALYEKFPELEYKAVCSSFFPNVIYMIRRANPDIICSLAWRPFYFSHKSFSATSGKGPARHPSWIRHFVECCFDSLYAWALPRILYYLIGISAILLHKDYISGKVINDWRDKGVRVIAWTVNQPVEKQHFSRNLKITYMTDTLIGETALKETTSRKTVTLAE